MWLRNGIGEPLGVKPGWEAYDAETRRSHQSHRITTYLAALAAHQGALLDEGLL